MLFRFQRFLVLMLCLFGVGSHVGAASVPPVIRSTRFNGTVADAVRYLPDPLH